MIGRRVRLAVAAVGLLWIGATPGAAADVEGPCTASFNGVAVEDIDDLASPLLMQSDDVLVFQGTDDTGTTSASIEVVLASITVDSASTDFGPVQADFSVDLDLAEMSPYAVGLFRIRGITDNCTASAWVRVTGRYPFTTLTGITAGGLALGGLAGQLTSIATRRRWSPTAAGLSGIATGLGGALIGQQFGRLQLSYISIGASIAVAALIGALIALMLRPREASAWMTRQRTEVSERRRVRRKLRAETSRLHTARRGAEEEAIRRAEEQAIRRAEEEIRRRTEEEALRRAEEAKRAEEIRRAEEARRAPAPEPGPGPGAEAVTGAAPAASEPVPTSDNTGLEAEAAAARQTDGAVAAARAGPEAEGPAWCYVMGPVDVVDLTDHTRVIGALAPGTWYLAKRQVGSWAHIVVEEGTEGWVPASSIHRQG
jgi:hypothetical protein